MLEETKERFRNIYASKKDTIDWMISSGDELDKTIGSIIKKVATEY